MTSQLSVNRNNMIKHISLWYYKTYTYLYSLYTMLLLLLFLNSGYLRLNTLSELV